MKTKGFTLIYPGKINDANGASTVINLLYGGLNLFQENGISANFYTKDCIDNKLIETISYNSNILNKEKFKSNFSWIKSLAKKFFKLDRKDTTLSTIIHIYLSSLKNSKNFVKKYLLTESKDSQEYIFIHDIFTCYYYIKNRKFKKPIVLVQHNNGETFKMLQCYYPKLKDSLFQKYLNKIEKIVLKNVDRIVFVAKKPMETFSELHPEFPKDKLRYVYNGIPDIKTDKIQKEKEKDRYELVCVASITDRKGQDIIIDAILNLNEKERRKFHFTFVGDGYLRPQLEKKIKENNLNDIITFTGIQKNVNNYLKNADIFILPSRDEGLPMSIIEAQRLQLPIISTKVAGIPEMIDHKKSGLLMYPDVSELTNILKEIDSYNWKEMGKRSRELFERKFLYENMIKAYSDIFLSMDT